MPDSQGRGWLQRLFWIVASGEALLAAAILRGPSHPYEAVVLYFVLPVFVGLLFAIMGWPRLYGMALRMRSVWRWC
jgi:hypothetical protein